MDEFPFALLAVQDHGEPTSNLLPVRQDKDRSVRKPGDVPCLYDPGIAGPDRASATFEFFTTRVTS